MRAMHYPSRRAPAHHKPTHSSSHHSNALEVTSLQDPSEREQSRTGVVAHEVGALSILDDELPALAIEVIALCFLEKSRVKRFRRATAATLEKDRSREHILWFEQWAII